eukprot:1689182-Alexandrium_andersonii.AAC.1
MPGAPHQRGWPETQPLQHPASSAVRERAPSKHGRAEGAAGSRHASTCRYGAHTSAGRLPPRRSEQ